MGGTFVSYGPNCEDVPLWRALNDIANGYYIDFSTEAADGASVTRAFYDRGWQGHLIRSNAQIAASYSATRPRDTVTPVWPLVDIATSDVHFVRIKDHGHQTSILRGLRLSHLRPWIVIIESGCEESGAVLTAADYQRVLFDGMNDFYVSPAHGVRASRLAAPANANDDFIRWDAPLAGRVAALETALETARATIDGRSQRLLDAVRALGHARRDIELLAEDAAWLRGVLAETREVEGKLRAETIWLQGQLSDVRAQRLEQLLARTDEVVWLRECLSHCEAKALSTQATAAAQSRKTSLRSLWRTTRFAARRLRAIAVKGQLAAAPPAPVLSVASAPPSPTNPISPPLLPSIEQNQTERATESVIPREPGPTPKTHMSTAPALPRAIRAVHQFHAGSGMGDAITNAMLLIQSLLRRHGFASEIFVETRGPGLETQIHLIDSFLADDSAFLLVHHSMGFGAFKDIVKLPVLKGLIYHNITPPELFAHLPKIAQLARLGHEQLAQWRDHVVFALSDSDYNSTDLHGLGFPAIRTCPLLCDVDALLRRAAEPRPGREVFTVLFVGRVTPSKAQLDLVASFAAFRARFGAPCRLVLVGSLNPDEYAYQEAIETLIATKGVADAVQLTDLVSDDELHTWYRQADLYVSLSCHEGFCVPLLEAMAYGIPILAWPTGAVPQTLGHAGTLLDSRDPEAIASAMLTITNRSLEEARSARELSMASLQRFGPQRAMTILLEALAESGVMSPNYHVSAVDKTVFSG